MTSPIHRGKCKSICAARLACNLAIDDPVPQFLRSKVCLSTPLQRQGPSFIADMVANPVIFSDVDKYADVSL